MRWLRPTVPRDASDDAIQDVVDQLDAAAHEAPPSHRAEQIRATVVEEAGADRPLVPGLAPLALTAGALLLALAVGVGAPAMGSFIGDLLDKPVPSDEVPPDGDVTDDVTDADEFPMPSDLELPTREVPTPSPSVVPAGPDDDGAGDSSTTSPADPSPAETTPAVSPSTDVSPWPPSGPPDPFPTPLPSGPPERMPGG